MATALSTSYPESPLFVAWPAFKARRPPLLREFRKRGKGAAALVLREALRFQTRTGWLIVHDAAGRAAKLLSAANRAGIDPRRVIWGDLAGRRRLVPDFRIRRSAHLRGIWASVLKSIRNVAKAVIGDGTIEWAAEAA